MSYLAKIHAHSKTYLHTAWFLINELRNITDYHTWDSLILACIFFKDDSIRIWHLFWCNLRNIEEKVLCKINAKRRREREREKINDNLKSFLSSGLLWLKLLYKREDMYERDIKELFFAFICLNHDYHDCLLSSHFKICLLFVCFLVY